MQTTEFCRVILSAKSVNIHETIDELSQLGVSFSGYAQRFMLPPFVDPKMPTSTCLYLTSFRWPKSVAKAYQIIRSNRTLDFADLMQFLAMIRMQKIFHYIGRFIICPGTVLSLPGPVTSPFLFSPYVLIGPKHNFCEIGLVPQSWICPEALYLTLSRPSQK